MKRWLRFIIVPVLAGIVGGESLYHWPRFRDLVGRVTGRGRLVSIVNGKAIYETDLGGAEELTMADAMAIENLRAVSAEEAIDAHSVEASLVLLQSQFGERKKFEAALRSAGLSEAGLREIIEVQMRGVKWLEKQIAGPGPLEQDCRNFYETHPELFAEPVRYRAAHLFLAAHAATPPEMVGEKEKAIGALAEGLSKGEPLAQLAAETSEDEASKACGGDLGYFSEGRMPGDFITEIEKLRIGETSPPFRTHLGFHIVQLMEVKPARQLTFEEARPEIALALMNDHRAAAVAGIASRLSSSAYSPD